jgi:hypothetical protein
MSFAGNVLILAVSWPFATPETSPRGERETADS